MKTLDDLINNMLHIFPNAIIEEEGDGQLVVYTGLQADDNNKLISMDEEDN